MSTRATRDSVSWLIPCKHPDYISKNVHHDFSILATGASDISPSGLAQKQWLGGFSGRPQLLADLFPHLRLICVGESLRSGQVKRNALMNFWRFLDGYERYLSENGVPFKPVKRLHDLTAVHINAYTMPAPTGTWTNTDGGVHTSLLRGIIRAARVKLDLPELLLTTYQRTSARKETPDVEKGIGFIRFLKRKAHEVLARWKRCDELAAQGRDLLALYPNKIPSNVTISEADAHATFRSFVKRTGNPAPGKRQFKRALGYRSEMPVLWPRHGLGHERQGKMVSYGDLVSGMFPNAGDIAVFSLLFLARSAWNYATVAAININRWSAPYDENSRWIFAPKARPAGHLQWTIASNTIPTSCYSLAHSLIERGELIRSFVRKNTGSCSLPDVAVRSPWVGISTIGSWFRVYVLDPHGCATSNNRLKEFLKEYNAGLKKDMQLGHMSCSDFRDLAAAAIYKDSQYSSWVLMVLLGHRNIATTKRYGFQRASYAESFHLLSGVVDDVFGQIRVKRKFDIAITRAKLSGMRVSKSDIARLEAARRNRTADGSGCSNPFDPPTDIDPGNKRDGCTICVQQHRCTASGCANAFVFSDSLPGLCRRVAELEAVKRIVGAVRFESSSDAKDLHVLRTVLKQWKPAEVEKSLESWRTSIRNGTHKPQVFAGRH